MKLIELHKGSRYIRTRLVAQKRGLKTELSLAASVPAGASSIENFKSWLNEPAQERYILLPRSDGKSEPATVTGKACIEAYLRELRGALRGAEVPVSDETLLCLSVPAYSQGTERKIYQDAITQAARAAGFPKTKLINEPDAVFEYFRLGRRELDGADTSSLCVLIIDFGGGTCNVSAVSTTRMGSKFQSVALAPVSADAPRAGGMYIDRELLSRGLREAGRGSVLTVAQQRKDLELWWERHVAEAEALKRVVSESGEAHRLRVQIDGGLADILGQGGELTIELTRNALETIVRNHWERNGIKQAVDSVLALVRQKLVSTAKRKDVADDPRALITHVILAGGSSQLPGFADVVREHLAPHNPAIFRIGKDYPFAVSVGMALNELAIQGVLDRTPDELSVASPVLSQSTPRITGVADLTFIPSFADDVYLYWRSHPNNDFEQVLLFSKGKNTWELLEDGPRIFSINVARYRDGGLRKKIEFQLAYKNDKTASVDLSGERLNLTDRFITVPGTSRGTLTLRVYMDIAKQRNPEIVLEVIHPDMLDVAAVTHRIPAFLSAPRSLITPPSRMSFVSNKDEKSSKQIRQLAPLPVLCIDIGTATTTCVGLHEDMPLTLADLSNYSLPRHIVQPKLEFVPRVPLVTSPKSSVTPLAVRPSGAKVTTDKLVSPSSPTTEQSRTAREALQVALKPKPHVWVSATPVPNLPSMSQALTASLPESKAADILPVQKTNSQVPATEIYPIPANTQASPADSEQELSSEILPSQKTHARRMTAARLPRPPGSLPGEPFTGSESALLDYLIRYAKDAKYEYPDELLVTFYLSLKVRPLVVLAGSSGVGKSALARLVAEGFGASYERGDALRMAVEAHWTDGRFLFGRRDSQGHFIKTAFHKLLLRASTHPNRLYHVLIDEMNLAHVEYYFAHILSAMEGDGWLDIPDRGRLKLPLTEEGLPLIRFCGTINVDETTQILSDKVIDRTNIIELEATPPPERVAAHHHHRIPQQEFHVPLSRLEEWRRTDATHEVPAAIREIWDALAGKETTSALQSAAPAVPPVTAGLSFGRRVVRDIAAFVDYATRLDGRLPEHDAIDLQVKQRILPKLRGDGRLQPILDKLAQCIEKHKLLRSQARLERMRQQLALEHFVTFWS